ncbi:MAG: AhpC/TSA family protein [Bacteroidales bacterium]|nr:AhpC/TSA family protein [Bacteroidales bacterium]
MKYSRFLSVALAGAAVIMTSSCTGSFKVNGKVAEDLYQDGLKAGLYIEDLTEGVELVESVDVKENGTFSFKGKADKFGAYLVSLESDEVQDTYSQYAALFIAEKGTVNITFSEDAIDVKGGKATDAFNQLQDALSNTMNSRMDEYNEIFMSGDQAKYDSLMRAVTDEQISIYNMALDSNSDNFVGLIATLDMLSDPNISLDQAESLLSKVSKKIQSNALVNQLYKSVLASSNASVGQDFIDFGGLDYNGKNVRLSDYVGKGKYVLADFWASWCGPCMAALPNVAALYEKYADKGLQLVGVNVWERKEGDGQACYKEKNMTWPVMFVPGEDATNSYGISAIPTLILFGPDGTILEKLTGEAGLAQAIAKHLGE